MPDDPTPRPADSAASPQDPVPRSDGGRPERPVILPYEREPSQQQRTARVLALLDRSFRAHADGDRDGSDRALTEAKEVDALVVSVIHGGILIGEVPNPERDPAGWAEYVAAATAGQEVDG